MNSDPSRLQPYVTAGVLLAIDQVEGVTPERVLSVTGEIRDTINLDGQVTADEFIKAMNLALDIEHLPISQQYIILQISLNVEEVLKQQQLASPSISATAAQVLGWVETAAKMVQTSR